MNLKSVLACAMFPVAALAAVGLTNPDGRLGAIVAAFWNLLVALMSLVMSLLTVPAMGVVFVLPLLAAAGAGAVMWVYRLAQDPQDDRTALVCASVSAGCVGALLYQTSQPAIFSVPFLAVTSAYFAIRKEEREKLGFKGDAPHQARARMMLIGVLLVAMMGLAAVIAIEIDKSRAREARLEQVLQNIAKEEAIHTKREKAAQVDAQIGYMIEQMERDTPKIEDFAPRHTQQDITALRRWLMSSAPQTAVDELPGDSQALQITVPAVGSIPSFTFTCAQHDYGLSMHMHTPMSPSVPNLGNDLMKVCDDRRGNY